MFDVEESDRDFDGMEDNGESKILDFNDFKVNVRVNVESFSHGPHH